MVTVDPAVTGGVEGTEVSLPDVSMSLACCRTLSTVPWGEAHCLRQPSFSFSAMDSGGMLVAETS